MPRALPCSAPSLHLRIADRAPSGRGSIKQKAGVAPAAFAIAVRFGSPGRAGAATRARNGLLLGLGLFLGGLFRLLRLLRFLSHSILSGFHGLNATPRHAWRRANLATSSAANSTDSQATAACCHGAVIALSTGVMRFRQLFAGLFATSATPLPSASCLMSRKRRLAASSSIQNHGMHWRLGG